MTFDDIQALDDTARIWPLRNAAMGTSGSAPMMDGSICMMPPCRAEMSRIQQTNQIGSTPPPGTASWHWCSALISTCCGTARAARSSRLHRFWCGHSMRQPLRKSPVVSANSRCGMRSSLPAMSRPLLSLVLAVLLLGVGCLSAHAATFYVSTAGADSVTCAQAQSAQTPRRTINRGIACLSSGDTLVVKPGVYDELLTDWVGVGGYTVRPPAGSSWANPTTIRAETKGAATIQLSSPPKGWNSVLYFDTVDFVVIDGFILSGIAGRPTVPLGDGIIYGIAVEGTSRIRFKDLVIDYPDQQGMLGPSRIRNLSMSTFATSPFTPPPG